MLFGFNCARWLLFVWFAQATFADFWFMPGHFWAPCVIFVPAICFLFRRSASDYFKGRRQNVTNGEERDARLIP
jgi:hypothetical protein